MDNMEYLNEKHKKERDALIAKYHRDMANLKVKQEQEKSSLKQKSYVKNLKEFMDFRAWQELF
ncbi:MAG: hypothetical protein WCK02_00185 [Bacteroidota bacterium]